MRPMAPLLVSLPYAALAAHAGSGVGACGGPSDDPSSLLQHRPAHAPPAEACPARNDLLESWVGLGLRVFLFDAASLGPVARALLGGAPWWDTYEAWAAEPARLPLANFTAGDPESPAAFIQAGLRPALEARSPQIDIVGSPEDADLVLWNVWDVALCVASGFPAQDWELMKGRLGQPCDAHFALLSWLTETPRWRRNHGRDHVLFADFPYIWESKPHGLRDLTGKFLPLTRNATLIGVEDTRLAGHRGSSAFVAVPYFQNASISESAAARDREFLVGLAATSVLRPYSTCETCDVGHVNNTLFRARIFDDLGSNCAEGECRVYDFSRIPGAGANRINISFYSSAGVDLDGVLQSAVFCPIPRGDSWTSKRFFGAILAGCIPVLLSDGMALPFAPAVEYRGAMLRIPEAQVMSPGFSLVAFLRSQSSRKIAAMQARLECIKDSIAFRPGCASSSGPGACRGSAMDFLVASLVRLAHHPSDSFEVTAAEHWRGDPSS